MRGVFAKHLALYVSCGFLILCDDALVFDAESLIACDFACGDLLRVILRFLRCSEDGLVCVTLEDVFHLLMADIIVANFRGEGLCEAHDDLDFKVAFHMNTSDPAIMVRIGNFDEVSPCGEFEILGDLALKEEFIHAALGGFRDLLSDGDMSLVIVGDREVQEAKEHEGFGVWVEGDARLLGEVNFHLFWVVVMKFDRERVLIGRNEDFQRSRWVRGEDVEVV